MCICECIYISWYKPQGHMHVHTQCVPEKMKSCMMLTIFCRTLRHLQRFLKYNIKQVYHAMCVCWACISMIKPLSCWILEFIYLLTEYQSSSSDNSQFEAGINCVKIFGLVLRGKVLCHNSVSKVCKIITGDRK